MSKYPFGRLAVGQSAPIPATSPKQTVYVAMSKFRDAVRREFGLRDDELPAFRITEDRQAGTYLIERLPDGESARSARAKEEFTPVAFYTEWVENPQPIDIDYLDRSDE